MTPDQLREWNAIRPFPHPNEAQEIIFEGHRCVVMDPESYEECFKQAESHAAALEEIERLKKENDTLRGLLGNSAKPCPYCGLPAEDQAKCPSGFPGCARADDQMLSKHFADAYRAEKAERRAERLEAEHYEAILIQKKKMQEVIDYWQGVAESRADKGE